MPYSPVPIDPRSHPEADEVPGSAACVFSRKQRLPRNSAMEGPVRVTEEAVLTAAVEGLEERAGFEVPKLTAVEIVRIATAAWEDRPEHPGVIWTWWKTADGGHALLRIWEAHEEPDPRIYSLVLLRNALPDGVKIGKGYRHPLAYERGRLVRPAPLGSAVAGVAVRGDGPGRGCARLGRHVPHW